MSTVGEEREDFVWVVTLNHPQHLVIRKERWRYRMVWVEVQKGLKEGRIHRLTSVGPSGLEVFEWDWVGMERDWGERYFLTYAAARSKALKIVEEIKARLIEELSSIVLDLQHYSTRTFPTLEPEGAAEEVQMLEEIPRG